MRGPLVESRHTGAVVVVDADGKTVLALGDIGQPVYPRSAVKPMQALPLIEDGVAERYELTDQELAVCCASSFVPAAPPPGYCRLSAVKPAMVSAVVGAPSSP